MSKILEFTLATTTIPVVIKTVDGKTLSFELFEMTAAQRDKHLDSIQARMKYDEKGVPVSIGKFEGMQADLLVQCMRRSDGNGVTKEEIQKWPATVVSKIYEAAQELNHLAKAEEDPTKND